MSGPDSLIYDANSGSSLKNIYTFNKNNSNIQAISTIF